MSFLPPTYLIYFLLKSTTCPCILGRLGCLYQRMVSARFCISFLLFLSMSMVTISIYLIFLECDCYLGWFCQVDQQSLSSNNTTMSSG
ncbi:hypothetical protein BDZ91DRAFT_711885 [Kalaharituber pfeilii]|nr:hypothetical protein BDZ91DRAFT_711885 [Kalaharituber pfeilii]